MENNNKKTNILIALVIVLGALVIILGGTFAFMYFDDDINKGSNESITDTNNNDNSTNNIISLDVSSSVIKETINNIIPWWYTHTSNYFYHKNDKMLASDISNGIKMELVLQKLVDELRNNPDKDVETTNDGDNFIISEDKIIKVYKQLFGSDKYEFTNYNDICPGARKLEDGRIEVGTACGGTGMATIITEIVNAEKNEEELYIYEVAGFLKYSEEENEQGQSLFNLYKDGEYKNLIAEKIEFSDNIDSVLEDKLSTYKYTFKSNGDGTYHFYSVEKQ